MPREGDEEGILLILNVSSYAFHTFLPKNFMIKL
jgi:hypothetical protein